ncbi:MAG: ribosome biogenesis GTPase Der [Bdellovibrionales bacterium]
MSSPKLKRVALVGRPNVGKSTLFNRLTRSRKAVVRDERGVTRDIQIEPVEWWGKSFEVVDTGGLSEDKAGFTPLIRESVTEFLRYVDLIVLIVDGRSGILHEDRDAFRIVLASGLPYVVVVNKCDRTVEADQYITDFYEFGQNLIAAAFEQDFGIDNTVEWILSNLGTDELSQREGFRLAILGKPNAGKSSLCNRLLKTERMLVSPIAGTTVDAIEAEFNYGEHDYILVDTAGLRRAAKQKDGTEVLGGFKTREAVRKSDLVLLIIDGTIGPAHQDARLIELCLQHHKGVIVVANKMDLGRKQHENFRDWFREKVDEEFRFFKDVPVVFTSAKNGQGIDELFKKVEEVRQKLTIKISTSQLNKFFVEVIKKAPAPVYRTQNVKFYYLTQTQQKPPSFIAFANHPDGVTPSYRRFLIRKIQENWDLKGIPLRIFVMQKGGS